jgi:hypothetical protein
VQPATQCDGLSLVAGDVFDVRDHISHQPSAISLQRSDQTLAESQLKAEG